MKNLHFSQTDKHHILIGIVSGLWIYLFLVLVGPFDVATVRLSNRISMMSGYALIFTGTYLSFIPIQKYFRKKLFKNKFLLELFAVGYLFCVSFLPTYIYYKSDFILGEYAFLPFLVEIYLPLMFLILSIILIVRLVIEGLVHPSKKVTIQGEGKYDMINLKFSHLIFIKSADNYIEIHYLENNQLKKKLIRYNLKCIKQDFPKLLQTHRSYLINPEHFISWNSRNSITLTLSEVPVSDSYRNDVLQWNGFHHK